MILSATLLFGAGCTGSLGRPSGSVIYSDTNGVSWQSRALLIGEKNRKSVLSSIDVTRLVSDPRNPDVLFLGTRGHGLFGSNNGGLTWIQFIPSEYVTDIAFDPVSRCTLYVLTPARALKTSSCGKTWDVILHESRPGTALVSLAVNPRTSSSLLVASTAGDVFRSADGGSTWSAVFRFADRSLKAIMSDSRFTARAYVVSRDGSIYRTVDWGVSWKDISKKLKEQEGASEYVSLDLLSKPGHLLYASGSAIFLTTDDGATWKRLSLLTPSGSTRLYAAAAKPTDDTHVVYVTAHTMYTSTNRGRQWTAQPLPIDKEPSALFINSKNGAVYLGLRKVRDESQYWYKGDQDY